MKKMKYLLTAPLIALLMIIVIYPFAYAVYLSLYDISIFTFAHPKFCGIKNYLNVLSDPLFWNSLKVTAIFVFFAIIPELLIGLGIALLLNREFRGKTVVQALIIMPMIIMPAVTGTMFSMLLNEVIGVIPYYLRLIGFSGGLLSNPQPILFIPSQALLTLIAVDIWMWTPFIFLILHSGLQALPKDPYEAALIDGASKLQIFRHITLPLMKPVMAVALIFRSIELIKTFDIIYIITMGGPGSTTETLSVFTYLHCFVMGEIGFGAALTVIILIFMSVVCRFMVKYLYYGR